MTKEITKAFIIQQIEDKFGLRELEPERFTFQEKVVPTYSIEQHIQKWETEYETVSITSGPTGFLFFSVPQTERWTLRGYNVVFMGAGAYTLTGVYGVRTTAADMIYLDMLQGQSVSYAVNLPTPFILNPNDRLYIYIDSYTSTQDLRLYIDVLKENIR